MKQFLKYFSGIFLLLIIAFTLFFFWASSPNLHKKEYANLMVNQYENTTDSDSIFSIITYNIGYLSGMTNNLAIAKPKELFENNLQTVVHNIKVVNPDIIAFQEIDYKAARSYHVNQQNEIAKLGYNHVAKAVNWDERYVPFPYWPPTMHFGSVISGQSILSKYPLTDHKRIVLERVPEAPFYRDALYLERLAQVVKVALNGQEVVVINVHLEAFDKQTRARQFEEVLEVFNTYKEKYPTILLGDFNSSARDKEAIIQKLFAMNDVGNAAFNSVDPSNTFNSKNPFERIDYIFYTKNSIAYIDGKVCIEFGQASDHLPLEMRFRLQ